MMFSSPPSLSRTDVLTGCRNLLSFADWLITYCADSLRAPMSLVSLDLNAFSSLAHDASQGDAVLRWVAIILAEELSAPIYRIGGDEFVFVLTSQDHATHATLGHLLVDRLNQEAERFGLRVPVATIAIIHYTGTERVSPADILGQLRTVIAETRTQVCAPTATFHAAMLPQTYDLHYIVDDMLHRMVALGQMLDESQQLANTDPVTGLPNLRAATQALTAAIMKAGTTGQPFTVLLIDGDNLRRYNELGYAVGDTMLQQLSHTLHERLRPSDFLARWRVGDEFLVLLPNTLLEHGVILGERLRNAVQEASCNWPFPITISIGVATYPHHGATVEALIHAGERAIDQAKGQGKNCVVAAV
ncbi:MAG TPA: diguanylate cyclase [Herpetosiphonaceae bacterium]